MNTQNDNTNKNVITKNLMNSSQTESNREQNYSCKKLLEENYIFMAILMFTKFAIEMQKDPWKDI